MVVRPGLWPTAQRSHRLNDLIFFLLAGLGIGALYSMLATGLVIVYRGSGVVNFAQGAFAMYGALTFDEARRNGYLRLPLVDFLPTRTLNVPVNFKLADDGVSTIVAFGIAVGMSVAIGLLAHFLVFRPLRNAAPLGKVIGSLGMMLYLQSVAHLNFGGRGRLPISIVPNGAHQNFLGLGRPFPEATIWVSAIAIALGLSLWLLFQYTRFGLATRANADNEKGIVLLGYSPQLLAACNWVIASVLATVTAIAVGPMGGSLSPLGLSALVVGALAAALLGRLQSIRVAMLGGFALGAVQTLLGHWAGKDWFPVFLQSGVRDVVPLVAIAAVLFFRGRSLPMRGAIEERRLPISPVPVRVRQHLMVWGVVVVAMAFIFEDSGRRTVFSLALTTSMVAAIIMLSMVVITGYVGQISLAQMSLAGTAAFVMARMMADGSPTLGSPFTIDGPGLPWPIAAALGVIAAIAVGLVLGLPAVRIRGAQLAIVTVAAAISLQTLYFENTSLTGVTFGAPANVRPANFFGISLASTGDDGLLDRPAFAIFCFVVLAGCALMVANLRRSPTGRRFLAVRSNERASAAIGIGVPRTKLLAFGIASGIAGIGGVMLGFRQNDVSSAGFIYQASLTYLAFAYLGGISSINGAIVGGLLAPAGIVAVTANYFLSGTDFNRYLAVIGGAGMIVMAIVSPGGIALSLQPRLQRLGRGLRRVAELRPARSSRLDPPLSDDVRVP
jgi:branched-chain amino acid transport system permease protein